MLTIMDPLFKRENIRSRLMAELDRAARQRDNETDR